MNNIVLEIITSPSEILKCLLDSKVTGKMVGITSPDLGAETYVTAVKDIVLSDEEVIILIKGYDLSGYFLNKNSLRLKDISSVIPFNSFFENPFLREMNKERDYIKNTLDNENIRQTDFIQ